MWLDYFFFHNFAYVILKAKLIKIRILTQKPQYYNYLLFVRNDKV